MKALREPDLIDDGVTESPHFSPVPGHSNLLLLIAFQVFNLREGLEITPRIEYDRPRLLTLQNVFHSNDHLKEALCECYLDARKLPCHDLSPILSVDDIHRAELTHGAGKVSLPYTFLPCDEDDEFCGISCF